MSFLLVKVVLMILPIFKLHAVNVTVKSVTDDNIKKV
jgi:hypothetical protein